MVEQNSKSYNKCCYFGDTFPRRWVQTHVTTSDEQAVEVESERSDVVNRGSESESCFTMRIDGNFMLEKRIKLPAEGTGTCSDQLQEF